MPEFHFDTIKTFPSIFSKYSLNSNEYITGGTENISYPLKPMFFFYGRDFLQSF